MTMTLAAPIPREALKHRVAALKLYGVLAHWDTLAEHDLVWVQQLVAWEDGERKRRGLERRLSAAHLGRFKPLADFDWGWPAQCDQAAVAEFMTLGFIREAANLILVGPNGVGKSMIAQNITPCCRGTAPCSSTPPRCWGIWQRRTGTTRCAAA